MLNENRVDNKTNILMFKIVVTICFILTSLSLILIERTPARGYEISIYSSNPLIWMLLIASTGGAIFLLVYEAFDGKIIIGCGD